MNIPEQMGIFYLERLMEHPARIPVVIALLPQLNKNIFICKVLLTHQPALEILETTGVNTIAIILLVLENTILKLMEIMDLLLSFG